MKCILLLLPLSLLAGCAGEQTRGAFILRAPSREEQVTVVDQSAQKAANLQRALDDSIRAQEAADEREWTAGEKARATVAALPPKPCAVHDIDNDTCAEPPASPTKHSGETRTRRD